MTHHDDIFTERDWYRFLLEEIREEASTLLQRKNYAEVVRKVILRNALPEQMKQPLHRYVTARQKVVQKIVIWIMIGWMVLGGSTIYFTTIYFPKVSVIAIVCMISGCAITYVEYGIVTRIRDALKEYCQ